MVRNPTTGGPRRTDRVGDLIRAEIADLITKGVKDPRVTRGLVTINDVDVSPDLRHAKVFVGVIGDDAAVEAALKGLQSAAGFFRRELGRRIRTKYTPELRFLRDATANRGARIEAVFARLRDEPPASDDGPADEESEA